VSRCPLLQQASLLVAPTMAPGQPPPPPAPEDKPRAYAGRIEDDDDDDDDDDGFGDSTCPSWPSRASGVDRGEIQITRVQLAVTCRLGQSGRMGTNVVWILDRLRRTRLDTKPCAAARDWIARADVPVDSRQVRQILEKLLVRTKLLKKLL